MFFLKITTIGEVAFSSHMKLEEGYRYDIPFDDLMLPILPIKELLLKEGLIEDSDLIWLAHPDGYRGIIANAIELMQKSRTFAGHIKGCFTKDRFREKEGARVRSIRDGMCFFASVHVPLERFMELKRRLDGRHHIGIRTEEITGEVELELINIDREFVRGIDTSPLKQYTALDYTALTVTPACFLAPYEEGNKTYLFIPGAVMRKIILDHAVELTEEEKNTLRFSNAYISKGKKRLLPVPACMSVVKLDKKQLRYRLAPGKDPNRVEQDVGLSDSFAEDFESHYMEYTTPETEHIASREGRIFDALSCGQIFCGTIYGSDSAIRKVLDYGQQFQTFFMGALEKEGYGEIYLSVSGLREDEPPAEMLSRNFDVCCASDTLLLNDDGMPACKAEDLLQEIEGVLGCKGKLEIEGRYTNIYLDYSQNRFWGADGAVVRCMAKGSVLRIRTKDKEPVDIFPLRHCFVGERTEDGYGELIAYPARGQYYRLAENVPPDRYGRIYPLPVRGIGIGAVFASNVLASALKSRIQALALADRLGSMDEELTDEMVPVDLLLELKDQYDPTMSEERMIRWYREGWEGEEDEADSA